MLELRVKANWMLGLLLAGKTKDVSQVTEGLQGNRAFAFDVIPIGAARRDPDGYREGIFYLSNITDCPIRDFPERA